MSAQPAYSYPRPSRSVPSRQRPDVRTIPGGTPREGGLSPQVLALAKIAVFAVLFIAALCCARVAFAAATVSTLAESQTLSSQISQAREEGTSLEVSYSTLSNPSNIKTQAAELGMVSSESTEVITLEEDVVAVDDTGALSLSESLKRAGSLED